MNRVESRIKRGIEVASSIKSIKSQKGNKNVSDLNKVMALSLLYIEKDSIEDDLQKIPLGTPGLSECIEKLGEV